MRDGDTLDSVARQHGTTAETLKWLNADRRYRGKRLRDFRKTDFRQLRAGDVLTVPAAVSAAETAAVRGWLNGAGRQPEPAETPAPRQKDTAAQQLAQRVQQAGSWLAGNPDGDAARALLKTQTVDRALGAAGEEITERLNRYGKARVTLSADDHFSLKNSSLDWLVPWYEKPGYLVFSQTGIHRTDGRTQANIGAGWRHLVHGTGSRPADSGDYLTGLNAFLDYDLSRDHARWGLGAEYRRNYLKLAANGYFRLTGWRDSRDFADYEERPADGWDIRAEGWLPSYPQLGAKLMYEQYYGSEVALFGKDEKDRQKNPHAFTAGITYTPFSLLTLTGEHRQGKGGKHDERLDLKFDWRFGDPLSSQLDGDKVAQSRSLAGGLYDFVDRNNNIILDYRKKEVIAIGLQPDTVEGKGGMTYPLTVLVTKSVYGLRDIRWDDAALRAAGGSITGSGTRWQVRLPAWQAGGVNRYTLTAVARDMRDNQSEPALAELVVTGAGVNTAKSVVAVVSGEDRIPADGKAQSHVRVQLRTEDGTPVTGAVSGLTAETVFTPGSGPVLQRIVRMVRGAVAGGRKEPETGAFSEVPGEPGTYLAAVTAGTTGGDIAVSVKYDGELLGGVHITATDTAMAPDKSVMDVQPAVITADGQQKAEVTLTALDKAGKPAQGEAGRLAFFVPAQGNADSSRFTFGPVRESSPGVYTSELSGTQAFNKLKVGVKANGQILPGLTARLDLTADTACTRLFWEGPATLMLTADNSEQDAGTVRAEDCNGNPLTTGTVTVSVKDPAAEAAKYSIVVLNPQPDTPVRVPVKLKTGRAGKVTLKAELGGGVAAAPEELSPEFDVRADVSAAVVTVTDETAPGTDVPADGKAVRTIRIKVQQSTTDITPLAREQVTLTLPDGMTTESGAAEVITGSDGTVSVRVRSTKAGTLTAGAALVRAPSRKGSVALEFVADAGSAVITMPDAAGNIIAAGNVNDTATAAAFTATVSDANGNPLTGGTVHFSIAAPAAGAAAGDYTFSASDVTPGADGTASVRLATLKTGKADVSAVWTSADGTITRNVTASALFRPDMSKTTLTLTPDPAVNAPVAGVDVLSYTFLLADAQGTGMPGQEITVLHDPRLTVLEGDAVVTGPDGRVTVHVSSTTAGEALTLQGQLTGDTRTQSGEIRLTFSADAGTAVVTLTAPAGTAVADNTAEAVFTAVVRDGNGNPLNTGKVVFRVKSLADAGRYTLTPSEQVPDNLGTAVVKVRTGKPGPVTLEAIWVNGVYTSAAGEASAVFTPDAARVKLLLTEQRAPADGYVPADGTAERHYALQVKYDGRAWAGQTLVLTLPAGTSGSAPGNEVSTDNSGSAAFTVTSLKALTAEVSAELMTEGRPTGITGRAPVVFSADEKTARIVMTPDPSTPSPVSAGHPYRFTVGVTDKNGNALTAGSVAYTATAAGDGTQPVLSHQDYQLTGTDDTMEFTSERRDDTYVVTATLTCQNVPVRLCGENGVHTAVLEPDVSSDAASAVLKATVTDDNQAADKTQAVTLQYRLADRYDNPLTGIAGLSVIRADGQNAACAEENLSGGTMIFGDDGNSLQPVRLTAGTGGRYDVVAQAVLASGMPLPPTQTPVHFRHNKLTLESLVNKTTGADGTEDLKINTPVTLLATVKEGMCPAAGAPVKFSFADADVDAAGKVQFGTTAGQVTETVVANAVGQAEVTVNGLQAWTWDVNAVAESDTPGNNSEEKTKPLVGTEGITSVGFGVSGDTEVSVSSSYVWKDYGDVVKLGAGSDPVNYEITCSSYHTCPISSNRELPGVRVLPVRAGAGGDIVRFINRSTGRELKYITPHVIRFAFGDTTIGEKTSSGSFGFTRSKKILFDNDGLTVGTPVINEANKAGSALGYPALSPKLTLNVDVANDGSCDTDCRRAFNWTNKTGEQMKAVSGTNTANWQLKLVAVGLGDSGGAFNWGGSAEAASVCVYAGTGSAKMRGRAKQDTALKVEQSEVCTDFGSGESLYGSAFRDSDTNNYDAKVGYLSSLRDIDCSMPVRSGWSSDYCDGYTNRFAGVNADKGTYAVGSAFSSFHTQSVPFNISGGVKVSVAVKY